MSLERILEANIEEAENILINVLGLTQEEIKTLKSTRPGIEIMDDTDIYAGYSLTDNKYIFSSAAVNDYLAIGEEVAHSIRLRLNHQAREFLLRPTTDSNGGHSPNSIFDKLKGAYNRTEAFLKGLYDKIKAVNTEEYFARQGALLFADYKGQKENSRLCSTIDRGIIKSYLSNPLLNLKFITHFYGYKMAERDYNNYKKYGIQTFTRNLLYDNDYSKINLPELDLSSPLPLPV